MLGIWAHCGETQMYRRNYHYSGPDSYEITMTSGGVGTGFNSVPADAWVWEDRAALSQMFFGF